jgi:hypothetical protein
VELLLRQSVSELGGGVSDLSVGHVARVYGLLDGVVVGDVVSDHAGGLVEGAESVVL